MKKINMSHRTGIYWSVLIVAVAGLLWGAADDLFAQGRGPCADDAAKYCKDVQPGGGRMMQCMKEHENDLSPACKEHIAQMRERGKGIHEACRDDALRLCKDVQPGRGGVYRCLKEHESELSPACKEKLPEGGRGR